MSDPVSALNGARFDGIASVEEAGLCGMITLRGDFASAGFAAAVNSITGAALPEVGRISEGTEGAAAWMSTDELLLMVPYAEVEARLAALNEALKGEHALAVNVSDARAVFRISGDGARETLAKVAPVDLSAEAFQPGDFRRSRMAQVAGAFWLNGEGTFTVVCFRSVGEYVFKLLSASTHPQSAVGVYKA